MTVPGNSLLPDGHEYFRLRWYVESAVPCVGNDPDDLVLRDLHGTFEQQEDEVLSSPLVHATLGGHPLELRDVRSFPLAVLARVGDAVFACADACAHKGGPLSEGRLSGARLNWDSTTTGTLM